MKKQIFVLAFLASILQGTFSFASILLVKEYGVNNTYPGIQVALNAAANNDTIVVYDKPSGQNWIENITIDKNIWLMHPVDTVRFKLFGSITIVPKAGMDLYLVGYDLQGNQIITTPTGATATSSNRAKITVSDCRNVSNINLDQDWIDARVFFNTTNITGQITFRHGLAIGNVLINGAISITQEVTTISQNDTITIIGNRARQCVFNSKEVGLIANNYLFNDINNGAVLLINYHNPASTAIMGIYNNTVVNIGGNAHPYVRWSVLIDNNFNNSNIKIANNLLVAQGSGTSGCIWNGSNVGNPFISHNYLFSTSSHWSSYSFNNELNYTSNSSYGSIDTWGRASSGNALLIDKGNYLGEYYDINLTRNDIGTYGGPYSIDNYINASTSKAGVLYINMPHTLTNINQLINVKASAGSKF
jgi:hypothetical protein